MPTYAHYYKNLHKYRTHPSVDDNVFVTTWDHENKKLDTIMKNEHFNTIYYNKKKSLMWLVHLKKKAQWKVGETLYIYLQKKYVDGYFECSWSRDKSYKHCCILMIEPTGLAKMKTLDHLSLTRSDHDYFDVTVHSQYNCYIRDLIRTGNEQ